ncbi:similar to Protein kinase C theta type (nPKC-theta) [Ectocarpus siliculosus]|uniref:Similar to Protein kinase C theta type (NPKC-theta) n=1 Tax=Ectocarpus siliculosus TaxID=2880 RepID=D7G950_ECTSI|nr:similar to Protein kinase C theta type (nPKC-theta) [Ectocarpus siliculosus]|eukprot:CBJ28214.1 similar to Protein kinase C theta type (nPKC-theta) [Ectocarpus siliculosus]
MELGEMDFLKALSDNIHTPAELLRSRQGQASKPPTVLSDAAPIFSRTDQNCFRFAAQMMDGIHFMHSKGIVHGDVKLINVLLVKEGGHHTVGKLADLGLARGETLGTEPFNTAYRFFQISEFPLRRPLNLDLRPRERWKLGILEIWKPLAPKIGFLVFLTRILTFSHMD